LQLLVFFTNKFRFAPEYLLFTVPGKINVRYEIVFDFYENWLDVKNARNNALP
jgi:hypothetical protein